MLDCSQPTINQTRAPPSEESKTPSEHIAMVVGSDEGNSKMESLVFDGRFLNEETLHR